jgi:hypothetical protein
MWCSSPDSATYERSARSATVSATNPFADRLWAPDSDSGSWSNVYSLLTFELISIPYDEVWRCQDSTKATTSSGYVSSYERTSGTIVVHRAEALLVAEYEGTLTDQSVKRIRTPAGITDLYVTGSDGVEMIEAKSGSDHRFVRQALGQLLDYAPHTPAPVSRLGALFPKRPAEVGIALLHRYGIDCIHPTEPKVFARHEAPAEARTHIQKLWHG